MPTLTAHRRAVLVELLQLVADEWVAAGSYDTQGFERRATDRLGIGAHELRSLMLTLLKVEPRMRQPILYFMEFCRRGPGPSAEFRQTLATAYGLRWHGAHDRVAAKDRYWSQFQDRTARERAVKDTPEAE